VKELHIVKLLDLKQISGSFELEETPKKISNKNKNQDKRLV